jgi:hypothetical protein
MSSKLEPGGMVVGAYFTPAYLSLTYFVNKRDEDVVLILAGVHAATKFIATGPKRRVEFGFF